MNYTMLKMNCIVRKTVNYKELQRCFCIKNVNTDFRINAANIQMINEKFHKLLFGNKQIRDVNVKELYPIFEKFKIDMNKTMINETVNFDIPDILGENIDIHLTKAAEFLNEPYMCHLKEIDKWIVPNMPKIWNFQEGWTKYNHEDKSFVKIDVPEEDFLIFDVETLPKQTQRAVMAVALGKKYWYSWTDKCLIDNEIPDDHKLHKDDLIPLYSDSDDKSKPKCVVGHYVSFDRARIRDEYEIRGTGTRFIDTMSMHIAIRGMTSTQRCLKTSFNKNKTDNKIWKMHFMQNGNNVFNDVSNHESIEESDKWITEACLNSLVDVYAFYFPQCDLVMQKDKRETFIKGTLKDVRQDFQSLMSYCANDVLMTAKIFMKMCPEYFQRFPHAATFTGMLEMGSLYLPVNKNFEMYKEKSNKTYNEIVGREKSLLQDLAVSTLESGKNDQYIYDPWLWDLDWKVTSKSTFPNWYKELVETQSSSKFSVDSTLFSPDLITSQMRVAVKLLKLKWDGLPLHYDKKMKWGVLIPGRYTAECKDVKFMDLENNTVLPNIPVVRSAPRKTEILSFPLQKYLEFWSSLFVTRLEKVLQFLSERAIKSYHYQDMIEHVLGIVEMMCLPTEHKEKINIMLANIDALVKEKCRNAPKYLKEYKPNMFDFQRNDLDYLLKINNNHLVATNPDIPFAWFLPLPHENGEGNFVGSPLSKSFLNHIQSGRLSSHTHNNILQIMLEGKKSVVFWRNYQNRVNSQLVVHTTTTSENEAQQMAILPQVIATGTVTRRSVERLWLTATNATPDRVGSELKAMVQPPSDWVVVGADVDSQEQWIAAVLGDSVVGVHGGTPFGWMALQGTKAEGTDLHSKTSKMIGISREAAKVLNYSRMYGAGVKKSTDTLLKFDPDLERSVATSKIKSLMLQTKGKKITDGTKSGWVDGTESEVFSKLEKIAQSDYPRTPILNAMLSKSLEKRLVNDKFMTSKCNWVVQSSGVDYLHCLLTFSKFLIQHFQLSARLCICIHDEIRYLCRDQDKFRLALILQLANLFTRSVFSIKLNLDDLPQSVAFFSEVDIDYCLRKNPMDDCKTPSNREGMSENYNIKKGESLNIHQILQKTNGGKLN